jgi:hypothetical protein
VLALHLPATELRPKVAELWSLAPGVAALTTGASLTHVIDPEHIAQMAASAAAASPGGDR